MMTVAQPWLKLLRFIKIIWSRRPVSQLTYLSPTLPPLTHKSDTSPISKYIWNTSALLLLSNDLEINPGPRQIDQNPVFCCIYSNKINRGIQQDTAPTCSVENCNARCHPAYNNLSVHQTRHAKNSDRSISWKCPQHGTGIVETIAPPPPVMRSQVVLLLLENPAPSVKIQFGLVILT